MNTEFAISLRGSSCHGFQRSEIRCGHARSVSNDILRTPKFQSPISPTWYPTKEALLTKQSPTTTHAIQPRQSPASDGRLLVTSNRSSYEPRILRRLVNALPRRGPRAATESDIESWLWSIGIARHVWMEALQTYKTNRIARAFIEVLVALAGAVDRERFWDHLPSRPTVVQMSSPKKRRHKKRRQAVQWHHRSGHGLRDQGFVTGHGIPATGQTMKPGSHRNSA